MRRKDWEKVKRILHLTPLLDSAGWATQVWARLTISRAEVLQNKDPTLLYELLSAKLSILESKVAEHVRETRGRLKDALLNGVDAERDLNQTGELSIEKGE